jgi:hypothetical protein
MMKRFLLAFTLVLLSLAASAAETADRAMLLAGDGTLYTVESVVSDTAGVKTFGRVLVLTVQNGAESRSMVVPASLSGGYHAEPAIGYDPDSKTLFVFWVSARNNGLASDLLFCSYQNGKWSEPTALDRVDWDLRHNLRIAVTRKTDQVDESGKHTLIPEVTVHAVWWQESGYGEWGRYAMITLDKGNVSSVQTQNLSEFAGPSDVPATADPQFNAEILRHPAVFDTTGHDSVDIVYGDVTTRKIHRLNLRPTAMGRLRIPIGHHGGSIDSPRVKALSLGTPVNVITGGDDNLAFYFDGNDALTYVVFKNGEWSTRTLALNDRVTRDAAVDALRRMVTSEQ